MALANLNSSGHIGETPQQATYDVMMIDDIPNKIHTTVVHSFIMSDVDDPEIYAAHPIWEWQQTDAGKWIMEHAIESPVWHKTFDSNTYGYKFVVVAKLREADMIIWTLMK